MPIEFTCSQCVSVLRVPDEHRGKQAKCPKCGSIISIPPESQPPTFTADGGIQPSYSQPLDHPQADPNKLGQPPIANPYLPTAAVGYYAPHRGGLILTLGILAIVCNLCCIPGIMAWVMGAGDLKKIKTGQMDPQGESLTSAGMILGIVGTALVALLIIIYVFIAMIAVAAGGGANF